MTQEQFNEWVNRMCKEYDDSCFYATTCLDGKTIICISKHGNRIGKAVCHDDDAFYYRIGTAIAYARATGQEVPTVIDKVAISSLRYGDKFIYDSNYIYVAKHPTKTDVHIVVLTRNGLTCEFLRDTLVEKI